MKTLHGKVAALLFLFVFGLVAYAAEPTLPSVIIPAPSVQITKESSGAVRMGDFTRFSFSTSNTGTNPAELTLQYTLLQGGKPVGLLAACDKAFYYRTNRTTGATYTTNGIAGSFSWGLTRMVDMLGSEEPMWPKAGTYTVLLGIYKPVSQLQDSTKTFDTSKFLAFAETGEFEVVGPPIPLVIHHYQNTPPGAVAIYTSGNPGDKFTLQKSANMRNGFFVWGNVQYITIGPYGLNVLSLGSDITGSSGFFRLRKEN